MKWFGENCVACPVRTIRRCFICKVPSTSSVLLHINDLFLDPPLELAKKLAQIRCRSSWGCNRLPHSWSSQCISCHDSALCLCKKWSQVDDRTKGLPQQVLVFFWLLEFTPSEGWIYELTWCFQSISVCVIGNTQQPPKAYVIAPPLLAPEDQRRPRAGNEALLMWKVLKMLDLFALASICQPANSGISLPTRKFEKANYSS